MSGRLYTITVAAVSVTAAQDLFEITPADDKPCEIVDIDLGQTSSTTQENIGVSIIRGHTTGGSGGSTVTPAPCDPTDTAAGFVAKINNTTVAANGTTETLWTSAWNLLTGLPKTWYVGAPKARQSNTTLVVRITAPAAGRTVRATLTVREL